MTFSVCATSLLIVQSVLSSLSNKPGQDLQSYYLPSQKYWASNRLFGVILRALFAFGYRLIDLVWASGGGGGLDLEFYTPGLSIYARHPLNQPCQTGTASADMILVVNWFVIGQPTPQSCCGLRDQTEEEAVNLAAGPAKLKRWDFVFSLAD